MDGSGTATSFLNDEGSFAVSFFVGMAAIAFYSRRRISELTKPPKGAEYDFVRALPIETIVGEANFNKAYVIYVLMLEFLYFFLCASKPLVLLIANEKTGVAFEGAAWPLGAALIVVGLLPSTPLVSEVETLLRGLAQRVANIPADFFNRIAKLTRGEIETLFDSSPEYRPERRKYRKINNVLACLDFPTDEAMLQGRTCVAVDLFAQWIIKGSRIWSAGELESYGEIIAKLAPEVDDLILETDKLLKASYELKPLQELVKALGIPSNSDLLPLEEYESKREDLAAVRANWTAESTISIEELTKQWQEVVAKSDLVVRKLCALFAILTRSDKDAVRRLSGQRSTNQNGNMLQSSHSDPVLRAVIELIADHQSEDSAWSEAAAVAIFGGFAVCFTLLSIYLYAVDFFDSQYFSQTNENAVTLSEAMRKSMSTTITISLSFGLSSIVSLFIRSMKIDEGSWVKFSSFFSFRVSNYVGIVLWCGMAAFMPLVFTFVFYNFISPDAATLGNMNSFTIVSALFFKYIFGMTAVLYAVATCVMADLVSDQRQDVLLNAVLLIVAILAVCFMSLVATSWMEISSKLFWHNMMVVAFHSVASIALFYASYRSFVSPRR
ncbi:hypothetical protein ADU59_02240 [Pararhizobium polonicum]|uniref:Uncharacterized protein n=1 Tax=Pararhizobium polonicum TaxID=1612624 RepID=A0A1C7P5Q4_9HYPH|nr:hypothetical protein [Pararhizobium polonicum]OBZ96598.1 hypothetical protein ADU59_02240 [Pararhizobium polonicum]